VLFGVVVMVALCCVLAYARSRRCTSRLCAMSSLSRERERGHGNFGLPLRLGYPLPRARTGELSHRCFPARTNGKRVGVVKRPHTALRTGKGNSRSYTSPRFSFPHVSGFSVARSELEVYQPMSCDHEDTWRLRGSELQSLRWRFDKFWEW
jgi:hypothetical protein